MNSLHAPVQSTRPVVSRVVKILAMVLATLLVALAMALVWLTWFFDIGAYRHEIVEKTRAYTGRELSIDGNFALDIFPRLSLRMDTVSLSQRAGFGDEPMVEIESLEIVVQWLPLLRGEVLVDHIELDAPHLRLGIDSDGVAAWGDIVSHAARVTEQSEKISDDQALAAGFAVLAIQGLVIRDGAIDWHDGRDESHFSLHGIEFDVDRILHRERGDFSFSAQVEGNRLERDLHILLNGGIEADFQTFDVELSDIELTLDDSVLNASLEASRIIVGNVREAVELSVSEIAVAAGYGDLSIQLESPEVAYRQGDEVLGINPLFVRGPGISAEGQMQLADIVASAKMDLQLETTRLDFAQLLDAAGVDSSGIVVEAIEDASLTLNVIADASSARIVVRNFTVAESDLSADVDVRYGDPAIIQVAIDSERLHLDSLLADPDDSASNALIPLAAPLFLLQGVEGRLEARLASVVSGGITFENLRISAVSDAQSVVLDPITAGVAGGELSIAASIDKAAAPPMSIRLAMRDADAGQLLAALGVTDRLSGTGSVEIDLAAVGMEEADIIGTLDGRVSIKLRDGRLRGIDIGRILAAARGIEPVSASIVDAGSDELQTPFSTLTSEIQFEGGVGRNRDAELLAPDFKVHGNGVLDLPRDRIDYRLAIHLAKSGSESSAASALDYESTPIPLRVHGAIGDPQVSLDMESLMKAQAERQIQREAERRGIDAPSGRDALREYLKRELEQRLQ